MDWFQILIILLFFLFPLIQQGLEAARRSREPETTIEGEEDEEPGWSDEAEELRTATLPRSRQEDGAEDWSSGWLDWPSPEGDSEAEQRLPKQVRREPEPAAVPAPDPVPAPSPEPEPSLEDAPWALPPEPPATPGQGGQLPTFSGRGAELAPGAGAPVVELEVTESLGLASPRRSRGSPSAAPLGGALATRSALRRAVVLHEVLGPPVALRQAGRQSGDHPT